MDNTLPSEGSLKFSPQKEVVVGIRCCSYGLAEESLMHQLQSAFSCDDIFFVVDETKNIVDIPQEFNKVSFDSSSLYELGLFSAHQKIGWLCGDYFYYFLAKKCKSKKYFLIEPDVLLNFRDLNIFFKNIIGNIACDFLAPNFGPSSKNWFWYRYAENISSSVYQCNFPLTLISSEAIEYLLQSRQDITATLRDGHNEVLYPNDESFVATTLMKGGFQCLSFNNVAPSNFSYFSTAFPMMYEDVINCRHLEGQVLHPVILKEDFWSVADMKASNFKLLNNQAISFIENIIISSGLTHSDIIEDVLCKYFLRDVRRLIEEKNKTRI